MSRDRFTEKDENGKWMTEMLPHERRFYIHRCDRTDEIDKDYLYGPAIERLAAYEDLIFSPEVLQAIIKEWKEWADAKNDGRLQVFPQKLYMLVRPCIPGLGGCPLYGGDGTFRCKVDGERKCGPFVCEVTYCDFMRHKIGDVYFATEEEAKKALEERYGK